MLLQTPHHSSSLNTPPEVGDSELGDDNIDRGYMSPMEAHSMVPEIRTNQPSEELILLEQDSVPDLIMEDEQVISDNNVTINETQQLRDHSQSNITPNTQIPPHLVESQPSEELILPEQNYVPDLMVEDGQVFANTNVAINETQQLSDHSRSNITPTTQIPSNLVESRHPLRGRSRSRSQPRVRSQRNSSRSHSTSYPSSSSRRQHDRVLPSWTSHRQQATHPWAHSWAEEWQTDGFIDEVQHLVDQRKHRRVRYDPPSLDTYGPKSSSLTQSGDNFRDHQPPHLRSSQRQTSPPPKRRQIICNDEDGEDNDDGDDDTVDGAAQAPRVHAPTLLSTTLSTSPSVPLVPSPLQQEQTSTTNNDEPVSTITMIDICAAVTSWLPPCSTSLIGKFEYYLRDHTHLLGAQLVKLCAQLITLHYMSILERLPIFVNIMESMQTTHQPLCPYRPTFTDQVVFWRISSVNYADIRGTPVNLQDPTYRYNINVSKRYSTSAFNALDVKSDGNCYYRCISLALLGDERHHWYFKSLLRTILCTMARSQLLRLYQWQFGQESLFHFVLDDVLQTNTLDFDATDLSVLTDDNIWAVHAIFCDHLLDHSRYANTIHYLLFYILFGINTRIWVPSPIDISKLIYRCEEHQFFPREDVTSDEYLRLLITALRNTVKSYMIQRLNQKSGYINVIADPSAQCPVGVVQEYRQPYYHKSNIGIDILYRDNNHFNVIHWDDQNIYDPSSYISWDVPVTRTLKRPYHIYEPKVYHAFAFPSTSMSDLLLVARGAATVQLLDRFLADHISHVWVSEFTDTSYATNPACEIRYPDKLSEAITLRRNKLL